MSRRVSWFEFGLGLFAAALPIGAIVIAVAPVQFFEAVGAGILGSQGGPSPFSLWQETLLTLIPIGGCSASYSAPRFCRRCFRGSRRATTRTCCPTVA